MNLAPAPDTLEAGTGERQSAVNLQDYLRVLYRYKWGIVALAIIGGLLAALKAYSDTPIYRATSTLLIERQAARFVSIETVYQANPGYDFGEYYQTQYEILKSRPLAERVVEKLGVAAFAPKAEAPKGFSLSKLFGATPAPSAPPSAEAQFESAVGTVQGALQVQPIRNSQLVKLQYEGPDPELIATLANTLGQAYIEETLEGRLEMAESASSWLNERLAGLRTKLEESEKALQAYRDQERLIDVKGVDSLAAQELNLATERLAAARRERVDKEALYRQVQQARQSGGSLDGIPALLTYPLVGELKTAAVAAESTRNDLAQRYGPRHPRMVEAQTAAETARAALERQLEAVADGIARDYESARSREAQLSGELGSAKGEVRDINRKQYELTRLEREVESNRQLYDLFQQRFKETSASGGVQNANARVVEKAQVPGGPVFPNKRRTTMVGVLLGLALGVALAFLLDHLDNTLKGTDDVERRLGLPVLGLLPRLETTGDKDRSPLRHFADSPKTSFSEAVRTVRTGVLLSAIDHPHRRLLVTSSVPGEGKTTLSVNLAHALGQMRKVLLIDADMRRPAVHRGLPDLETMKGLSQFVAGDAQISECVSKVGDTGQVFVMPAGPVPPNPQELLSSHRFAEALESLSAAFDHVIIDCAPSCAVSDALVLSRMVHAVIYVVRSDSTPYQLAEQGVKRLRRVNAPLIGAVVNQVVPKKGRGGYGKYYYYGDGYYHDYGYGAGKPKKA
jgi:capsular exopolysaccharide synthesis family protein